MLEIAEYRYGVAQRDWPWWRQEQQRQVFQQEQRHRILQVGLPVGRRLTVDYFRSLLRSFDGDRLHQLGNTGALPFHVACRTGAPVEILELLLQEYPGALCVADNTGSLPIHYACQANVPSLAVLRFLLQRDPAAVRARDNTGALPLHRLCGSDSSVDAVQLLLAASEGSVSVRTSDGDLPLMVAYKTRASLDVCMVMLRAYPDALEDL